MAEQATSELAGLLRQLRAEARLTQQELAKAAGVSPRAVSDLERGINRTARRDTAVRLAAALGLAEPARSLFVAAARGRIQAAQVLAARPAQPPGGSLAPAGGMHGFAPALTSFIGRAGPLREVAGLLDQHRLVTVTGPGGVGKTRLAGQVANQWRAGSPTGPGWPSWPRCATRRWYRPWWPRRWGGSRPRRCWRPGEGRRRAGRPPQPGGCTVSCPR